MINLSDFDFKSHLNVFRVIVDDVAIADVPIGNLEHFLLCLLHANRSARIRVTLVMESDSSISDSCPDEFGLPHGN